MDRGSVGDENKVEKDRGIGGDEEEGEEERMRGGEEGWCSWLCRFCKSRPEAAGSR